MMSVREGLRMPMAEGDKRGNKERGNTVEICVDILSCQLGAI